ncbi:MAG: BREX-2 system phosphatase PglZ, partial [Candidatus Competibacteraceae bacterium]|nr:BREX-2 system phosphatase PglZ [Candidatus Competibacteraceae bacterium]
MPQNDLQSLLQWSLQPGVQERYEQLPPEARTHLGEWLQRDAGRYAPLVLALFDSGHGQQLLAVGLMVQVLYHPAHDRNQEVLVARGRFSERYCGGRKISPETLIAFGDEAAALTRRLPAQGQGAALASALGSAEPILASLDALALAIDSDLLPMGFQQRLEELARVLDKGLKGKTIEPALEVLERVKSHQQAAVQTDRVERAAMAVRLLGWLQDGGSLEADGAGEAVCRYGAEGGFIDWARSRIWAGDENAPLDRAYQALTRKVTQWREAANQAFAGHMAAVARGDDLGPRVLPVEALLDQIVIPLARGKPLLLVVMDGMSQAVYEELTDDLARRQWIEYRPEAVPESRHLLSVLPTVTRYSRTSLLAGALCDGNALDEKKRFARHPGLKSLVSTKCPPVLYHKGDLSQPGSGGLAGGVRAVVAGREHRAVAVVINAVDDQLGSSAQVAVRWQVDQLTLLRQLLQAARESARTVVLTSDHGHVIDHDMKYRAADGSGERYREQAARLADDECLVTGPRVLTSEGSAVLPWSEKVRFGANKFGYHGGGSLQEVIIPLGVFLSGSDREVPDGWREVPREYPPWWQLTREPVVGPMEPAGQSKTRGKTPAAVHQDLFEPAAPAVAEDWVTALGRSPVLAQQKARLGRVPVADKQLTALLELLARSGGQVSLDRVVQSLKMPRVRLNGFLSSVRRLLNVDGYPVLAIERDQGIVVLNIDLLKTQFEL